MEYPDPNAHDQGNERLGGERHEHASDPRSIVMMSPASFAPMNGMPGIAAFAKDDTLEMLWCNGLFAKLCGTTPRNMIGKRMSDDLAADFADERESKMRVALNFGQMVAYYELWHGSRWYTRIWPLDPSAFGTRGIFAILQSLPQAEDTLHEAQDQNASVLVTGHFEELDVLSARELEVFYHIAHGLTSQDIAALLFRSARTIEQHVNQIYKKLGTPSRAQLTRFAVERGIVAFSRDEWQRIVDNRSKS